MGRKSTNSKEKKSTNTVGEKQPTISNFGTKYFGTKSTEVRKSTITKSTEIYKSTEKKNPTKLEKIVGMLNLEEENLLILRQKGKNILNVDRTIDCDSLRTKNITKYENIF